MWSTTDLLWSITLLSSSRFVSQNPRLCSLSYKYPFKSPLPLFPLTLVEYNSNSMPSKYKKFCTYSKVCKNPHFVLSSVTKLFDSTDNGFLLYLTQLEQGELASLLLSFKEDLRISHNQYSKKHSEPGGRAFFCGAEINLCSVCKVLLSPPFKVALFSQKLLHVTIPKRTISNPFH